MHSVRVPYVLFVLYVPLSFANDDSKIAARVAGEPILISEVEREISIAFRDRPIAEDSKDFLQAKALEQLVKRRLILHWLAETKQAAQPDEVERAFRQLQQNLTERGLTLADYFEQQQLDEVGLRRSLGWQIGWQRYIDKQLVDKNLERYFEQNRREFDGSRMHVAQILLKVEMSADAATVDGIRNRALQLLTEIRMGKTLFAEAARLHSDSPSREQGGDLGWIGRYEPMPESFSRAAFALEPMQVSEPIRTTFGIHLIQCLEIKPGTKKWQEVKPELEQAVTLYLFDWAAQQVRSRVDVEYTKSVPPVPGTEPTKGSSK